MNPLIGIAASILPDIIKLIAGDTTGGLADAIAKAVASAAGTSVPADAKAKLDADPAAETALQQKLAELAIEATKTQNAEVDKQRQDQLSQSMQADANTEAARQSLDSMAAIRSSIALTAPIISYLVIGGFFVFLFLLVWLFWLPATDKIPNQTITSIINIVVGALTAAFATVVNFWLGSSAGSRNKDAASINMQQSLQKSQSDQSGVAIDALGKKAAAPDVAQPSLPPAKTSAAAPSGASPSPAGSSAFDACIPLILQAEGGYSDNPNDPGGPTNFGITLKTLEDWEGKTGLSANDVKGLSLSTAREIYRTNYWNRMQCGSLPDGLDLEVFDFGVNAGPGQAVKTLQQIVGVTQDGSMGPITLAAVGTFKPDDLLDEYAKRRIAFYQSLPTAATFLKGWVNRVNQIQTAALKMAAGSQTMAA